MIIRSDFSALWAEVDKISKNRVKFFLTQGLPFREPIDLELDGGKEITLEEVDFSGPVAAVQGRQVLLYIPDHGFNFDKAMASGEDGNKFHVTFCKTLENMKSKNRFERYYATNNLSGVFQITGMKFGHQEDTGATSLIVCKNCLNRLNYKNASKNARVRQEVTDKFNIPAFFETYSSCFMYMPSGIASPEKSSYTEDWSDISSSIKQGSKYICQKCGLNLTKNKRLLHVHHKNGVKTDNSKQNLVALCADCHRKEPHHEHMHIPHKDTQIINRLRREQTILHSNWENVEKLADPAILGLLGKLKIKNWKAPEIGFRLKNIKGEVIAELEAAWPDKMVGLVISMDGVETVPGWKIKTLGELLRELA